MTIFRPWFAVPLVLIAAPAAAQSTAPATPTETPATDDDPALAPRLEERPFGVPFGKAWIGAADGDVTLYVLADYACPACRAAQPVIDGLVAADPHLKVVYLLLINEDEGKQAALTSLAVAQSAGDWAAFHRALDAGGDVSPAGIAAALKVAGVDLTTLPPLDGDAVVGSAMMEELIRNDRFTIDRKVTALPAWAIGTGKAANGFDAAVLRAAIAKARKR